MIVDPAPDFLISICDIEFDFLLHLSRPIKIVIRSDSLMLIINLELK